MNSKTYADISIKLPDWSMQLMDDTGSTFQSAESRMALAIRISRLNIEHGTGGPFGAVIFDMQTYKPVAIGMNLVVPSHCSLAHAEMVAISAAQQRLQCFDLGADANRSFELATSCEPCAMCFGALPWSGIRHLVCGARDEDARAIGFDEGPKIADWKQQLEKRGISVITDVCRQNAAEVLNLYAESEGIIYNGRQG